MHSVNGSNTPPDIKGKWRTPKQVFDTLDKIFNFNLDAYASEEDKLCSNYIGESDNAHTVSWSDYVPTGTVVAYCNPPYAQPNIKLCLEKARRESLAGATVVVLIPNQPAKYWESLIIGSASELWITLGRLSFVHPDTGLTMQGNAGGSVIVVYTPRKFRPSLNGKRKAHTEYVTVEQLMGEAQW